MKTGKTLVELAQEMQRINSAKKDFIVPTSKLEMTSEGKMAFTNGEKHEFDLNSWSAGQVASYSDIPKQYFDRIRGQSPELLSNMVNHGLNVQANTSNREGRMLRTLDGKVRGFLSPSYRILDSYDLMEATLPTLMEHNFNVVSSEITDKRLYLKAVTSRIQGEVAVNDVLQYGIVISTSDVGGGALKVEPFFLRLACSNGLISESKFKAAHLGRNKFEDTIHEIMSDKTKRLNDAAFFATVRDYLLSTMNKENFERELDKMRNAAQRKIQNFDLEQVIDLTANEVGIKSEAAKKGILAALASGNEGAGLTQWGLANSFTAYAKSDDIDYETATELERAGGSILELSPSQWKKVAVA